LQSFKLLQLSTQYLSHTKAQLSQKCELWEVAASRADSSRKDLKKQRRLNRQKLEKLREKDRQCDLLIEGYHHVLQEQREEVASQVYVTDDGKMNFVGGGPGKKEEDLPQVPTKKEPADWKDQIQPPKEDHDGAFEVVVEETTVVEVHDRLPPAGGLVLRSEALSSPKRTPLSHPSVNSSAQDAVAPAAKGLVQKSVGSGKRSTNLMMALPDAQQAAVPKPEEDMVDLMEPIAADFMPDGLPPPLRSSSSNHQLSRHHTGIGMFEDWKLERDETVHMGHEDTLSRLENASYRLKLKAWKIAAEAGKLNRWREIQCAEKDAAEAYLRLCELDLKEAQELAAAHSPEPVSEYPAIPPGPPTPRDMNAETGFDAEVDHVMDRIVAISQKAADRGVSYQRTFAHFDVDNDGTISRREFRRSLQKLGIFVDRQQVLPSVLPSFLPPSLPSVLLPVLPSVLPSFFPGL
jgi:hypothetical protein